jgi:hypothetical protein
MNGEEAKVAIVAFSSIHRDARVLREVSFLSKHFRVNVIGFGSLPGDLKGVQMNSLSSSRSLWSKIATWAVLALGRTFSSWAYERVYWKEAHHHFALEALKENPPHAIHANDWNTLPVAVEASKVTGAKVVLDLHEYAPLEWENRWHWNLFYRPMVEYFLKKYLPSVSASVTVNETIADRYRKEYGFRPVTVMNIPQRSNPPSFRTTDPQAIKLVHHGGAIRDRRLELMIRTIPYLDVRYTLHFLLVEMNPGYIADLKRLANTLAPGRIFFHPPVPPQEIVQELTQFDMGFFLIPPINFNYSAALPNKFFDFVAAGLSVCIGPSSEMARLTRQFEFGIVTPSFEPKEVAKVLNEMKTEEIDTMKQRALKSQKRLNGDNEMGKLVKLYKQLLTPVSPERTMSSNDLQHQG